MTTDFQRELTTQRVWHGIDEHAQNIKATFGTGGGTVRALGRALYLERLQEIISGADPIELDRGIERAVATVDEALAGMSRPLGAGMLVRVGTIWADNNKDLGNVVAKAITQVGATGHVLVERGAASGTLLEVAPGTAFPCGFLSAHFITDPQRQEVVLDNAFVLVLPDRLHSIQPLVGLLGQVAATRQPLLIAADELAGGALASLVVNKLRGTIKVAAVALPVGPTREKTLRKIAALTGAAPVTGDEDNLQKATVAHLGRAEKVVIDASQTIILGDPGAERRGEFDQIARIRVGGKTDDDVRRKIDLVRNAVKGAQAALGEGIVPGGGVALIRAADSLKSLRLDGDQQKGADLVARAIEEPLRRIQFRAGNDVEGIVERIKGFKTPARGFNARTNRFENLMSAGVVEPVGAIRSALNASASMASRLSPAEAADDDAPEEPPRLSGRTVNAWLAGTTPPLHAGATVSVGFRIGAAVKEALAHAPFSEPGAPGELWVMLWARNALVEPDGYWLYLPQSGNTRSVFFVVTPEHEGQLNMRFRIYLKDECTLLQELAVSVPVVKLVEQMA